MVEPKENRPAHVALRAAGMHKYQWLRICADEFKKQLEEYAKADEDVAQFLKNWMPLYGKIQRREIRLPYSGYDNVEFHRDDYFCLAIKYGAHSPKNSLYDAQLEFSMAIKDYFSTKWYAESIKKSGKQNPVDEPPPPEEEAPLPKPPPSSPPESIPWWRALSNKLADGLFAFLKNVCG